MIALKDFILKMKETYGNVIINMTNVAEITSLTVASALMDLDSKYVITNGILSSHKTEPFQDEDESIKLKSSVNVKKATWVAIANITILDHEENSDEIKAAVNITISAVGDVKYEDIANDIIKSYMRI